MFLLLISDCTIRKRIILRGVDLITRRVAAASHTQSTVHGEDGLITVGSCCKTIRTSSGRCDGDRKRGECRPASKGGGEIIDDHPPLARVEGPGRSHGATD